MCSLCPPLTTQYLAVRYSSLGSPRTWNPTALRVPAKVQKGACTVHRRTKLLPRRAADIRGQERAKPIQPLSVGRLGQTGLLLGGSTVSEMKHVDSVAAARTLSTLLNSTKRTTPVAVVSTPAGRDASYIDAEELHAEVGDLVPVYLIPTLEFVLGVLAFHEPMTLIRWIGFALVWLALAIFTYEAITNRRPQYRLAAEASPL